MTTVTQQHAITPYAFAAVWDGHVGYISGPMTDRPQGNAPAFDHCATVLRRASARLVSEAPAKGFTLISPAELDRSRGFDIDSWDGQSPTDMSIDEILSEDVVLVAHSHFLVLLPGWEDSGGGTLEIAVAVRLSKPTYAWDPNTETLCPLELSSIIAVCQQSGHTGSKIHGRVA